MDEHAATSLRSKPDSSLRVAFELLRSGDADAVVSAGHSGAMMAGALLVLGRLPGVDRPAIATLFPSLGAGGGTLLLDAGANVACKPRHLAQFAVMGAAYVSATLGVVRPRVAVLSNGEEPAKGTDLTRGALGLLTPGKGVADFDFRGYCEGADLFGGELDVVVTDGFTGNVVLKASEGAARGVTAMLRQAIARSSLAARLGAALLKPTLEGLRDVLDPSAYGGAPLLGVNGVTLIAHGRSGPRALFNALESARKTLDVKLCQALQNALVRAEAWLPAPRVGGQKGATSEPVSE